MNEKCAGLSRKTRQGQTTNKQFKEPIGAVESINNHNKRRLFKNQELSHHENTLKGERKTSFQKLEKEKLQETSPPNPKTRNMKSYSTKPNLALGWFKRWILQSKPKQKRFTFTRRSVALNEWEVEH